MTLQQLLHSLQMLVLVLVLVLVHHLPRTLRRMCRCCDCQVLDYHATAQPRHQPFRCIVAAYMPDTSPSHQVTG
jgi:hypothetical protein